MKNIRRNGDSQQPNARTAPNESSGKLTAEYTFFFSSPIIQKWRSCFFGVARCAKVKKGAAAMSLKGEVGVAPNGSGEVKLHLAVAISSFFCVCYDGLPNYVA